MKTHSNHPNRTEPTTPPASSPLRYAALRRLGLLMAALMFLWSVAPAWAQIIIDTGGTLTGDTITFANPTTSPIIDYSSFSISSGQNITIDDANVLNGRSLHRISGETSLINGGLKADNIIYLVNPNGIIFGGNARVDVGGLVASALRIDETEFLTGNPLKFFYQGGTGNIVVSNGAQIAAAGIAYFLGQSVDIQGSVRAGDIFVGAYGGKYGETLELETAGKAAITLDLSAMGSSSALVGDGTVDISNASIEGTNTTGTLGAWAAAGLLQTNGVVTNMAAIHMQAVDVMRVHTLYADAAPDASISLSTLEGYLQLDRDGILHASSNITMVSTNNFVLMENNSSLTAGRDIKVDAGLSVTMNGGSSLTAGGNAELTSGSSSITLRAVTSLYGNVTADSGAGLIMQGDVTAANGAIDLKSARVVQMESASSLTASNNITLNSESAVIYLHAVTSLYGNVAVTNQGHILLDSGISATNGTVDMRAESGDIRFDLYGRSSIRGSNVWLYAGDTLDMTAVRNYVVATNGAFTASNSMTLPGFGASSIANDLSVTSLYGGIMIEYDMNIGGDASFAALGGELTVSNMGTAVSVGGNLTMNSASNLYMRTNTAFSVGGDITLASTDFMWLHNISAGGGCEGGGRQLDTHSGGRSGDGGRGNRHDHG